MSNNWDTENSEVDCSTNWMAYSAATRKNNYKVYQTGSGVAQNTILKNKMSNYVDALIIAMYDTPVYRQGVGAREKNRLYLLQLLFKTLTWFWDQHVLPALFPPFFIAPSYPFIE